jgi:hypothetical protein
MFGADCFLVRGHMFAFTWEDDIALWVPEREYEDSRGLSGVRPVEIRAGIPMGTWLRFPLRYGPELLPRLRRSHEHYRERPPKSKRHRGARASLP